MYKNYDEALQAAISVINKNYNGEKHGCCISETKLNKNSRCVFWDFRFNSKGTNGEFVQQKDGSFVKLYEI